MGSPPRAVLLDERAVPVGKILCVGRNYVAHAGEMGVPPPKEPLLFLKPATAVVRPDGGELFVPASHGLLHHEIELAVLLGDGGKAVGYGVALDLTLRDLQAAAKKAGGPWAIAKGFDRSAPIGDFLPAGAVPNPADLPVCLEVNGETRQQASTADMIFTPAVLAAYASRYFTLEAGDLLITGTPAGVGPLDDGDVVHARIGDLPELRLTMRR